MFTYQVRPRVFRLENGSSLTFPANGTVKFVFGPLQPFGVEPGGGHTAVRAVAAKVIFNANTGQHYIESEQPLKPLDVALNEPNRTLRLNGNILEIDQYLNTNIELTQLIEGVYFALPALLNIEFADPPLIERVEGLVGGTNFSWELMVGRAEFRTTTQDEQEMSFANSWERIGLLLLSTNTRLFAAIHFYYVAIRLLRESVLAGEFLPEVILNFSKILEVLFPPKGNGKTRDAVRIGLSILGFSDLEIEADFIPAMALRNEIGIGHVDLALFKPEHLKLIHGYVAKSEYSFHKLLKLIFEKVQSGEFVVDPYERKPVSGSALAVIDRMKKYEERYGFI